MSKSNTKISDSFLGYCKPKLSAALRMKQLLDDGGPKGKKGPEATIIAENRRS